MNAAYARVASPFVKERGRVSIRSRQRPTQIPPLTSRLRCATARQAVFSPFPRERRNKVSEHEKESGSASMQIAFFHVSTDRHRCGTKAPCTSQAQAKTSLCTAQEGSAASQCDTTDASQAATKERAGHDGVVLIQSQRKVPRSLDMPETTGPTIVRPSAIGRLINTSLQRGALEPSAVATALAVCV
jgi:hypothetical protein